MGEITGKNLIIKIYIVDELGKRQIMYDDFMREYRKLKREAESLSAKKGNNGTAGNLDPISEFPEKSTMQVTSFREPKSERHKKLIEALNETKRLTQILEGQLKALDERGVYGEKVKK